MLEMYLALQALIVRDKSGELASLVQTRSQQTRDLLDDSLTSQEGTVLLCCKQHQDDQPCQYDKAVMRMDVVTGVHALTVQHTIQSHHMARQSRAFTLWKGNSDKAESAYPAS